jgi:uncharacterized protein YndB with AHSA1/START domain
MIGAEHLTIATPTPRDVVVTRGFDAPRDLVFDALTRPALLQRWLEAPGRSMEVCEIDLKVRGAFHFVWRGPGRKDVGMRGVYLEIVRPERIVHTETWEDWDAGESHVTIVLTEHRGKTTFTHTARFPSQAVRDGVFESGLEQNAKETYDKLAALLAAVMSDEDSGAHQEIAR